MKVKLACVFSHISFAFLLYFRKCKAISYQIRYSSLNWKEFWNFGLLFSSSSELEVKSSMSPMGCFFCLLLLNRSVVSGVKALSPSGFWVLLTGSVMQTNLANS